MLEPILLPELNNPAAINIINGEEIDDPVLADQIINYAAENGYDLVDLVKTYNRNPQDLPPEAISILDGLRDDRLVRVYIKAYRPSSSFEQQTEKTITIPGEIISGRDEEKIPDNKDDGGEVIFIPIILPIPGLSRRRKGPVSPAYISTTTTTPTGNTLRGTVPTGNTLRGIVPTGNTLRGTVPTGNTILGSTLTGTTPIDRTIITDPIISGPSKIPVRLEKDNLYKSSKPKSNRSGNINKPAITNKQPRNHNFSKANSLQGGRLGRSHGGDRRSKRAPQ